MEHMLQGLYGADASA